MLRWVSLSLACQAGARLPLHVLPSALSVFSLGPGLGPGSRAHVGESLHLGRAWDGVGRGSRRGRLRLEGWDPDPSPTPGV